LRKEKDEAIAYVLNNPKIELLLDSGAFSALNRGSEIQLEDYMLFLEKWQSKLFGYMALDKLGDPVETQQNLEIMIREGFKPIPIHVRGDTKERMDELFEISDYVALGGFRRPHKGSAPAEYVKQKMLWARGRKVHWLGYTPLKMVREFTPYSCDSSTWASAAMYGIANVYYGAGKWSGSIGLEDAQKMTEVDPRIKKVLDQCGLTVKEFRDPDRWRSTKPMSKFVSQVISAASWVKYVRDLRGAIGTRHFLASARASGSPIYLLFDWINKTSSGEAYPIDEY
jgi:hypothetical protein